MRGAKKDCQLSRVVKRRLVVLIQIVKIVILMERAKNLLRKKRVVQTQTVRIVTPMELVRKNKPKIMTQELLQMFKMGRTRLTNQLPNIKEADLVKKLHPNSNSVGFLMQHIAEVEQLFAKNVFGLDIKVTMLTVGKLIHDTGKFKDLNAELELLNQSASVLEQAILKQSDADWQSNVTTAEFGTVTKAEALSRIISHTAYHAGQIGLILKYAS
jgi:uncharacterized damage-inducible protein DinB